MEVGRTWHHVEGGQGLQLVPKDLHDAYKHTGGRADIKGGNWFQKAGEFFGGMIFSRAAEAGQNGGDVATARMQDAVTFTPVVGDALDLAGQGLDAAEGKLKNILERPGDPHSIGNMRARILKEE